MKSVYRNVFHKGRADYESILADAIYRRSTGQFEEALPQSQFKDGFEAMLATARPTERPEPGFQFREGFDYEISVRNAILRAIVRTMVPEGAPDAARWELFPEP